MASETSDFAESPSRCPSLSIPECILSISPSILLPAERLWRTATTQFPTAAMHARTTVVNTIMNHAVNTLFPGEGTRVP
ncbi:MAG: hypothetical protein IJ026_01490 [Candidatus Methanomethylophilaceae archaeon]|nr:hypothetical protein [Candidatus Methanomethylophilaceae archaeon]